MRADPKFVSCPQEFWANIRTISQVVGYTEKKERAKKGEPKKASSISVPSLDEVKKCFTSLNLSVSHIVDKEDNLTGFGKKIFQYFEYRATILNGTIQYYFMDKKTAEVEFKNLKSKRKKWNCKLPFNKQKGKKRNYAFFTCIVNMLIESNIGNSACDYDPSRLTTVTHLDMPLRTLSRRVDGAFPSVINPVAIWEIKEYYYTTTFGSRVADGVYETLLDGMEIEEMEKNTNKSIQHVLFVDDKFTWWECGRSYLCRMIDMLHMGYVDEIIFGREVFDRLPLLAIDWTVELSSR